LEFFVGLSFFDEAILLDGQHTMEIVVITYCEKIRVR